MIHVLLVTSTHYKLYDLSMMDPSIQNFPRVSIINASHCLFSIGIMLSKGKKSTYKTRRLVVDYRLKPFQSNWADITHSASTIFLEYNV